ncbi:MAG TPA: type II secretion system F family protein [Candidatus Omnitrophota bacterium]|jgi:type IV pilus assembly protein PilC|nr:type II secretion system F family protein [Candidatus Omnitrophota bacterium]HPN56312.1 type II secretion system F family protein [Candidatus Omnitrophota bacterium]
MNYKFVAMDPKGKRVANYVIAENMALAIKRLKDTQLLPLRIDEAPSLAHRVSRKARLGYGAVTAKDLAIFTRQLAAMLNAGLILSDALLVLSEDCDNEKLQRIVLDMHKGIVGGLNLSGVLSRYPQVFSRSYVAIIKSGEMSGQINYALDGLAEYLEKQEELKESVKSALSYPVFVMIFSFMVMTAVVLFLIPKFQEIYSQSGESLPYLTRVVIDTSSFINAHLGEIGFGLLAVLILLWQSLRFSLVVRLKDIVLLKIPVFGKGIIHKFLLVRFCRTMSLLLAGGVDLSTSLTIASQVVHHDSMSNAIERVRRKVLAGASIHSQMKQLALFPHLVVKMVDIGEKTGNLPGMLTRIADYYESDMNRMTKKILPLIEPSLIVLIGGFVCFVIVALYLPVFNVSFLVQ